jgi:hypothetical protein
MIVLSTVAIVLIAMFDNNSAQAVGKQLLPASIVGLTVVGVGAMLNRQMADHSAAESARE